MTVQLKLIVAASLAACTSLAQADAKFDANVEYDLTKVTSSSFTNGGRIEFNASGRAENAMGFVEGRGTVLLKSDGTTGVDDAWIALGTKQFDAKVGRFEATDLFPVVDVVLAETGYTGYRANKLRGRFNEKSAHVAFGLNAADGLRLELGLVNSSTDGNVKGVRPVVSYSKGAVSFAAGLERVQTVGTSGNKTGLGLRAAYQVSDSVKIGASFAKLKDDKSFGMTANVAAASFGLIYNKGATSTDQATTVSAAYSLPLFGIKGASITPALSYSKPKTGDAVTAVRVRLRYDF